MSRRPRITLRAGARRGPGPALAAAALLLAAASPADSAGRGLVAADAQARWMAVGRLNVAGRGFCTGALISARHVVTAAHCIFHPVTRSAVNPREVHFLAGYRKGSYAAHRRGRRIAISGRFDPALPASQGIVEDLAVVELDAPIPGKLVRPLRVGCCAEAGDQVTTVSYGMDRPEALSIQTGCVISERRRSMLLTTCEATGGVSGAPLLRVGSGGAELVGVVSAMGGSMRGAALAVRIDEALAGLRRKLE